MNLIDMQVKIFKALAHPLRIKILQKLSAGTLCVCELNEDVDIDFSQANLSQHLKILRDANIIGFRKEGLKVFYYVKNPKALALINLSEEFIQDYIKEMNSTIEGI